MFVQEKGEKTNFNWQTIRDGDKPLLIKIIVKTGIPSAFHVYPTSIVTFKHASEHLNLGTLHVLNNNGEERMEFDINISKSGAEEFMDFFIRCH